MAYKTELHCATLVGEIKAKEIEELAAAGFEGVETYAWDAAPAKAREGRHIAEANGIKIHSVMCGAMFNGGEELAKSEVERLKVALKIAGEYGASSILVVPARVDEPAIRPWKFNITFDPNTCLVSKVVDGDNAPYAAYIAAQNNATVATQRCVAQLVPTAAYEGVTMGLENVWNNLWCSPTLYAALVRSFDSLRVKSYFDLGNHVKYSKTEDWLRALGKGSIVKMHIKDFLVDKSKPNGGDFCPIGKGSIDWKSVRDVIEEIEYDGFVTLESGGWSNEQHVQIFKNFFNGVGINDNV